MKSSDSPSALLQVIKAIVFVYDIITYPIYYILQRPWEVLEKAKAVRARPLNPKDPTSPWKRLGSIPTHPLSDCKTLPEAIAKSIESQGREREALGYREVLAVDEERQPNGKSMKKLVLTDYKWLTLGEVDDRIGYLSRALLVNGAKPKKPIMMFSETRLEWFLTAQAAFRAGIPIATLYATLGDDGVVHGINETEVSHIVTSVDLLPKLAKLMPKMPHITHVIYMEGPETKVPKFESRVKLVPFSQLEADGKAAPKSLVGVPPTEDDTAVILYTSGSTGVPKGVVTLHKNVMACVKSMLGNCYHLMHDISRHRYIAYLPLAHSLEFSAESFFIAVGVRIGYGSPFTLTDGGTALKRGVRGDAALLRPTVMAAVPLILDRIRKGIYDKLDKRSPLAKQLFNFAMSYKTHWENKGFSTPLVNGLICKYIKGQVGGSLEYMMVGGAPLSPDTQKLMRSCLNIKLMQGYGTTETASTATLMDLDDRTIGRIGAPLFGAQVKIIDWEEGNYRVTDKPNPRGELVVGGDQIAAGYFKLDKQTEEVFKTDENGVRWFYSGDIGEVFPDGTFRIIDRKKDLVKLQQGEYISLGRVEAELKSCSYVDNICVYGNSMQTYVVALVVPNVKALMELADELEVAKKSLVDLCGDGAIVREVTKAVMKHGCEAGLHRMEIPTKLKLCADPWTPDNGMLTAALKLKRKNIENFYQNDIKSLYGIQNNNVQK